MQRWLTGQVAGEYALLAFVIFFDGALTRRFTLAFIVCIVCVSRKP